MSFPLQFNYQKKLKIERSPEVVYAFVSNYSESIPRFFPGICRFELRKPSTYFWEFKPMNYGGKNLTISFSTQFEEGLNQISILPIAQSGNTLLSGQWRIEPHPPHCHLNCSFDLEFEVPLPSLTKSFVIPLAKQELLKLFDQYTQNVQNHFK